MQLPPKDYTFPLLESPKARENLAAFFLAFQLPDGKSITLDHPVAQLPAAEYVVQTLRVQDGLAKLAAQLAQRETAIENMVKDPLRWGHEPECWKTARELLAKYRFVFITTRNRNTKSEFGGKEVVLRLLDPERRAWCLCESNETSIRGGGQQELIWKYLPNEYKAERNKRGKNVESALNYSPKEKFSNNAAILPNKSEVRFMNYQQDIDIIEGGAIDFFWADELVPVEWIMTLIARLLDRNGRGLATFTPVRGYNETYGMVMQGGRVLEVQDFPLHTEKPHWPGLPKGKIPYIVESINGNYAGMIFPPHANPYVKFETLVNEYKSASYDVQMIRLAGIATKKIGNRFPKFGKCHVLPASAIPAAGTNYQVIDFQGRNWFMLWVRVVRVGERVTHYVYREWPDKRQFGEWAIPNDKKPNGVRGPAQEAIGYGYKGYRDVILSAEGWKAEELKTLQDSLRWTGDIAVSGHEIIYDRLGDPRSGQAPQHTADEGGTCNFDELARVGIMVRAAKGLLVNEGIDRINDLLDYNADQYREDGQRFTPLNAPGLMFSEECGNMIDCMTLWTGQGSEREQASKDPIDCLRYLATEDLDDIGGMVLRCVGGGAY